MKQEIFKSVILTTDSILQHYKIMFKSNFIQIHELTNYYGHFPYNINLDKSLFDKQKYRYFDINNCTIKLYPKHYEINDKCISQYNEQYKLLSNYKKHLSDKDKIEELEYRLKMVNKNRDNIITQKINYEIEKLNDIHNFINANTDIYIDKNYVYNNPINQWVSFSELISLCIKKQFNYDVYVDIISMEKNRNIPYSINIIDLSVNKPVISIINTSDNYIRNEKFLSYKLLYFIFNILDRVKNITDEITNTYVYSIDFDAAFFAYNYIHKITPTNELYIDKIKIINSLPEIELINKNNKIKKDVVVVKSEIKNKLF